MDELCYDITKHRSTVYLCVCRKKSPYELTTQDQKILYDLVGGHNLHEMLECLYEAVDDPFPLDIDIEEIMRTSGMERGGQATLILEWAIEEGYCEPEEFWEEDETDEI